MTPRTAGILVGMMARATIAAWAVACVPATPVAAQTAPTDLARISIEELMNIEITSASRKQQRVGDTPAAVYVLTNEDIRRSGLTTLPDVLRLVPGVDVAQISADKWAVSVRGFNAFYSNKLLVLIDGRTLYNRLYSGVLWDAETVMLDDVERIEVVRGPGGATWGANAVNGVINIVTKAATDTRGTLVRVGAGGTEPTSGAARYGGSAGALDYRLFSEWITRGGDATRTNGASVSDRSHALTSGGRADWSAARDSVTLEGHAMLTRTRALWTEPVAPGFGLVAPVIPDQSEMSSGAVNGWWLHRTAGDATLRLQSAFDLAGRREPVGSYQRRAGSLDLQYQTAIGARHDVVSGLGYQLIAERLDGADGVALTPSALVESVFNAFVQDEIAIAPQRLAVTLGAKVEHETASGWSLQPTARALWSPTPAQRVWAAVSRSLRTPSSTDRYVALTFLAMPSAAGVPLVPRYLGNPEVDSESVKAFEAGYRLTIGPVHLSADAFASQYERLLTAEPIEPRLAFEAAGPAIVADTVVANGLAARTRGVELAAQWQPATFWQIDGGYSAFHYSPRPYAFSRDAAAAAGDGDAPAHQWQARSRLTLTRNTQIDVFAVRVGPLRAMGVPGYVRADGRVEFGLTPHVSLAFTGQNLFDEGHVEFADTLLASTIRRRSVDVRLFWRLR